MKHGLLIAAVAACIFAATYRRAPVPPATPAARPVLLVFTATWCMPCKRLHAVMERDTVKAVLSRFDVKAVDIDLDHETAKKHNVSVVPALIVGDQCITGYQSEKELIQWLSKQK